MRWQREGTHGMISEPYRVGKFTVDEGALATLYGLWYEKELIGYFNDFDECKQAAEKHNAEHNRRPAASSPGVRVDGPVGPLSE